MTGGGDRERPRREERERDRDRRLSCIRIGGRRELLDDERDDRERERERERREWLRRESATTIVGGGPDGWGI